VTDPSGLLQQHENRKTDDPVQIHHAAKEQQQHQEPAATKAKRAVLNAHMQGARPGPSRQ
jgi:hypothetical protein